MGHGHSRHLHKSDSAADFLAKHTFGEAVGAIGPMVIIPGSFTVARALAVLNGSDTAKTRQPVLSAPVIVDA
jgi:hypothetical protein